MANISPDNCVGTKADRRQAEQVGQVDEMTQWGQATNSEGGLVSSVSFITNLDHLQQDVNFPLRDICQAIFFQQAWLQSLHS